MRQAAVVLVFCGVICLGLAPSATISLLDAALQFLGEIARVIVPSMIILWAWTPEVLHPLWGGFLCGLTLLLWIGYSLISIVSHVVRRDR